ncbi:MAG TPA: efflux RND transporter periplasmic adaptor subunit [Phycisphaerae bacterium]|nr:efflux RND transporter periplasmic adaptor subunit [Phycisphaerae bacterium]HOJ76129.1 efflux RND transporter periplasmic adaptor subunit [Phycisphaerae bacterium]HOM53114.1 efflux RND transporter periplasmic adaptor subunit [Phycisphaerae bacterium]HOQ85516.1 efflux RND transporter periplasmic adaptor subunit [Phycisphaerae bacterium]HPP25875.1 efflux RND transporter periplasmic adaptor subunit [Phycisphaerae bacterium]
MRIQHGILFVIAGALIGTSLILSGCDKPTSGAPQGPAGPPEVAFIELQSEPVTITTELPARTAAFLIAEVRPQVGGIIQKRLFEEGGDVKAGDVLYHIDPAPYQAAYDTAVAALARAEANLPSIQLRVSRYEKAVAANAVSQQEYDDALAALKQANADIAYGKASVEAARINLEYTKVTAPITGRIGRSNVTVGALVSAHQAAPLATIQQLDPIYVDAPQSSANLLRLRRSIAAGRIKGRALEETRVKLLLEDGTPYPLEGTLKFPDVTVDPSTGSFILRMVFPNPDHTLLPGMYVRAVIEEGVVEQAILAPQQGVSRDHKGRPVALVIDAEGKIEQRILTAERAIGDKWLISSGLQAGDRIVVEGSQRVRPGVMVKAVPFTAEPEKANLAALHTASPDAQKN